MKLPEYRKTKLELLLLAWTALNVAIGIWVLLTGQLHVFGSGLVTVLPLAIGLPAAAFLLWHLLKPTRAVLLLGTLFWALQIVSVRLPDALYKFRLGLSVDFRLTDNPNYIVAINLLAIIATAMFATAAARRPATKAQGVTS
jgi:hypothetical protein